MTWLRTLVRSSPTELRFRNLCDYSDDSTEYDDEAQLDTEAEKLNAFYSVPGDKLKIGITCNKCGTGTTLEDLDAVAFLKDTTQAIPFIQKSQRVRTPLEGKTVGYCLCFNQWQGLKAFCDFSRNVISLPRTLRRMMYEMLSRMVQ